MKLSRLKVLIAILPFFFALACVKSKAELKREQELEHLKTEVQAAKGEHADEEVMAEELKEELERLASLTEERFQKQQTASDDMKKDVTALMARVQALEQRAVAEDTAAKQAAEDRSKASYDNAKRLFDDGKYEDSAEMLRNVLKKTPGKSDDAKKAHFLFAESLFAGKDYASSALEFSDYQKDYPKDALVPTAIYRQANAFRNLGKMKEAKLFYQELLERFPKHPLAAKAKQERKRLK